MLPLLVAFAQSSLVRQSVAETVIDNGKIVIRLDHKTGLASYRWGTFGSVESAFGEAKLDGKLVKTTDLVRHDIASSDIRTIQDKFGSGVQVRWRHRSEGQPEIQQIFSVYKNRGEAIVQLKVIGRESLSTNYLSPMTTEAPVKLEHQGPIQALFVPYDNDMYFRYRSDGWGEGDGDGDGSYGVGSIYDDLTRRSIMVGSIDNDVWKSAVRFKRNGGVRAYAGVTSKYTHDIMPHGSLSGKEVVSPRFVAGSYADWRDGLERYGDLNAIVKPPLKWKGDVPFGWNSWAGHKAKVNAEHAKAATLFVKDDLPKFRNNGTAYINFDSFWDNLTRPQLLEFVDRAHKLGLKVGIYYTPFTGWSDLDKKIERGSTLTFQEVVLKDDKGQPLPKLDGGWPLDPTHPGVIERTRKKMADFVDMGFDFVKLDFLSHGSLEGVHYDKSIKTGTQAYALGMKKIADQLAQEKIGRPFFISLSIAPMFPQGYAHTRRISCDVFSNIGATEYLLNSSTYGWWTNRRIYQFNDPDATCVYQPMDEPAVTEAESISRMTASVISGGILLNGDDLTKPEAKDRAKKLFTNPDIIALAKRGLSFRPVNGNSETKAGDQFYYRDGKGTYLAVFNYDKTQVVKRIQLDRIGITGGAFRMQNLWTGEERSVGRDFEIELKPMQCAFVKLD